MEQLFLFRLIFELAGSSNFKVPVEWRDIRKIKMYLALLLNRKKL